MPGIQWTYSIPGPLVSSYNMPGIQWTYSVPDQHGSRGGGGYQNLDLRKFSQTEHKVQGPVYKQSQAK